MARLNTYPNDENVSGSDKVIGTDANTGGTKNFTLSSVSNWMNDAGAVKILGQSNYVFQGDGAAPRRVATISVEDYSNNVAFSDVTQLIFSQNPAGGHDIVPYLNAIIGKKIIIGNLTYLENFGIYTLFSVEEFEPGFYTLELDFVEGSGALYDEGAYGFAPWALEPLDALDLQDVTDIGSTTTHGITTGGLDVTGINRITIGDATNYFGGGGLQIGGTGFSAAKMHLITSTTGTGSITFGDGLYADTLQGIVSYDHSSNAMYFVTARAERLRIDGNGNVGIGTTSPEYLLDVNTNNIRVGVHTFGHGGSDVTTNLAIGQNALDAHSGSTGSAVAIGPGALQYSTDASYATAIGEFAGANDNGTQSTFIGSYTGPYYYALTGGYNTMVGAQAGIQMSGTAEVNTGIGNGALYNLSTGNDNTALGQSAGSGITTGSGNIMIGVGNNGISTGSNNVIIGRFTGLAAGLSNNVIIGDGAGNKRIVFNDLGELQIPDLTAGYLKSDADGNITVDTDTIEDTLDSVTTRGNTTTNDITVNSVVANGNITSANNYLILDSTANDRAVMLLDASDNLILQTGTASGSRGILFNTEGAEQMRIAHTGNVGIGTTAPNEKLHVAGNIRVANGGKLYLWNDHDINFLDYKEWQTSSASGMTIENISSTGHVKIVSNGNTGVYVNNNGNVGIGTTSPDAPLTVTNNTVSSYIINVNMADDVDGGGFYEATGGMELYLKDTSGTGQVKLTSSGSSYLNGGNIGIGNSFPQEKLHVSGNIKSNHVYAETYRSSRTDGDVYIQAASSSDLVSIGTEGGNNNLLTVLGSGNVGIGTASPSNKLHVVGDTRIEGNLTVNGTYTQVDTDTLTTEQWNVTNDGTGPAVTINQTGAQDIMDVQDDGTSVFYIEDGGNVGIGTTDPVSTLTVLGTTTSGITVQSGAASSGLKIFNNSTTDEANIINHYNGPLILGTSNSERMRIAANGRVGIGTTSPQQELEIVGAIRISEDIEWGWGGVKIVGSTSTNDFRIKTWNGSSPEDRVIVDGSGNVGIGTTTPLSWAALHVNGTIHSPSLITTDDKLRVRGAGQSDAVIIDGDGDTYFNGGNVGIGTTSPGARLQVNGSTSDTTASALVLRNSSLTSLFSVRNDGRVDIAAGALVHSGGGYANTSTSSSYFTGNVGIGTTSPSEKLDVNQGYIKVQSPNVGGIIPPSLTIGQVVNAYQAGISSTGHATVTAASNVYLRTGGSNFALTALSNGNVGIGTTSPGHKLDVGGSININSTSYAYKINDLNVLSASGTYTNLHTPESAVAIYLGDSGDRTNYYDNNTHRFRGAGGSGDKMFINSSGNVGIGTTSPNHKLDIYSNENVPLRVHRPNNANLDSSGAWGIGFSTRSDGNNSVTDTRAGIFSYYNGNLFLAAANTSIVADPDAYARLTILNSGNVGIGTTSPAVTLHVNGFARLNGGLQLEGSNRYVYAINNTSLLLGTNNTERMRITNTGNVGIGLTNPLSPLSVKSNSVSSSTSGFTLISNATNNIVAAIGERATDGGRFHLYDAGVEKVAFYSDGTNNHISAGNVGIGTTSPLTTLHSYSTQASPILAERNIENGNVSVQFKDQTSSWYAGKASNGNFGISRSANLGASTVFNITATDRVGIGTTTPTAPLHIEGGVTNEVLKVEADANPFMRFVENGTNVGFIQFTGSSAYVSNMSNGSLLFRTNNTDKVAITGTGNVGIGTTSPGAELHVKGAGEVFRLQGDTGQSYMTFFQGTGSRVGYLGTAGSAGIILESSDQLQLYAGSSEVIRITSSGNVGIGTTSPSRQLELRGQGVIRLNAISGGDPGLDFNTSDVNDMQIRYRSTTDALAIYSYGTSSDVLTIRKSDGKVGIGTTSPQAKFHAIGHTMFSGGGYSTAYNSQNGLVIDSSNVTSAASTYGAGIEFTRLGDSTIKKAGIVPVQETADSDSIGLSFHTARTTTTTDPTFEVMRLSHDSKVGIGSSSPSSKLEVNGTAMSQLRMVTSGGPSSSSDTSGNIGDLAYDADHLYIKTSNGWGRVALDFAF